MVYFGHENSEILVMALANFSKKELGFGIGGWEGVRSIVIRTPMGKKLSNNQQIRKTKKKKKKERIMKNGKKQSHFDSYFWLIDSQCQAFT